ncbi:MAG: hypothetical protein JW983_01200 [Elusimicrobia bacterium]|nr:hypothetical protein [Elusimicrobiota bacterium]
MKILRKVSHIYFICILLLLGAILLPLKNKIVNETSSSVALAAEYNDIADFFGEDKFNDFKKAGITTIVLADEKAKDFFYNTDNPKYKNLPREKYLGISESKIARLLKLNFDIVLLIMGDLSLLPPKNPNLISVIMSDGSYGELPANSDHTFGIMEFSRQKEIKKILKERPEGFRLLKLYREKDYKKNIQKIRRAVLERNIKIVILDMSQTTIENALEYSRQAKNSLEKLGFNTGRPVPIKNINPILSKYSLFTKITALSIAILSPFLICPIIMNVQLDVKFLQKYFLLKVIMIFLTITIFSLVSGIVITGLLSTKDFMLGVDLFRGIKIALILPIMLSFILLYGNNIKKIINKPILYGELLVLGIILASIGFYIMRSGNFGIMSSAEETFRICLEKIFLIRPRLKEFLIGHPFMLTAIYLKYKGNSNYWKPFFLMGLFGQISIINTFCHIHSPFFISLLRTFNGICLGTVLGIIFINIISRIKLTQISAN